MGVTLERVQNKFACIIGELCSEPDILSEFAIWLDLRLAEYKAKGALQLECSGKSPDPTWLRGHKKSAKSLKPQHLEVPHQFDTARQYIEDKSHEVLERLSPEIVRVKEEPSDSSSAFIPLEKLSRFDSVPQYTEDRSHEVCERLSPENVCGKEEPSGSSDIFPVNIYCHEYSSHVTNTSRKRTLTDSCSNKHSVENIPLKMQRLLPSSSVLEPVNQILMSIISENTADDSADLSSNLSADRSNIGSCIKLENSTPVPSSDRPPSTSSSKPTNHQDRNKSAQKELVLKISAINGMLETKFEKSKAVVAASNKILVPILDTDTTTSTGVENCQSLGFSATSSPDEHIDESQGEETESSGTIQDQVRDSDEGISQQVNEVCNDLPQPASTIPPVTPHAFANIERLQQRLNIGSIQNPVMIDKQRYERIIKTDNIQKFVLGLIEGTFSNQELAESNVMGGKVSHGGKETIKKRLCRVKMNAIYTQAAMHFKRPADTISNDRRIRNAINSKCRNKKILCNLKNVIGR